MTVHEAIRIVLTAAYVRRDQWQGLADSRDAVQPIDREPWSPAELITELYEVWEAQQNDSDDSEAEHLAGMMTEAIEVLDKWSHETFK